MSDIWTYIEKPLEAGHKAISHRNGMGRVFRRDDCVCSGKVVRRGFELMGLRKKGPQRLIYPFVVPGQAGKAGSSVDEFLADRVRAAEAE